ncbi:MAG: hypothetical protein WAT12_09455, partial [Candidatus Nitrotoga sp.]
MMQILANSLVSASLFVIVGLGFAFLYESERFFNFFLGFIIAIGAYALLLFIRFFHMPLALAILLGLLLASTVGATISFIFIRPLRQLKVPAWGLLIVSLGLYLISQNALSIAYGDKSQSVRSGIVSVGHNIFGAYVTDVQLATFFVAIFILFFINIFLVRSDLGRTIRGVSSNDDLC